MKLAHVDHMAGGHLAACLRWLETLTASTAVVWNHEQRRAARCTVEDARRVLQTDLVALAQGVAGAPPADWQWSEPPTAREDAASTGNEVDPRFAAAHYADGRDLHVTRPELRRFAHQLESDK